MSLGTYQWLLGGENEVHSHTEALFDLKEQNYGFYKKKLINVLGGSLLL